MINSELLKIMACPACKKEVKRDKDEVVCTSCQRRYPVKDGIPIMLESEAIPLKKGINNNRRLK